jgi:hypothetical protein
MFTPLGILIAIIVVPAGTFLVSFLLKRADVRRIKKVNDEKDARPSHATDERVAA